MKKFLLSAFVLAFFISFLLPVPGSSTAAATNETLIIINKASNELAYYENNKLNRIFSVATGKSPSLTPEGNFIIVNKIINRPYYKDGIPGGDPRNPLGDRWLGLNARGTWGTTYAIHGNNNPASIGNYVSLGCIRMYDEEVRWLFEQVAVNTPVIIVTETSSFDSIAKANGHNVTTTVKGSAPAITSTLLQLGSHGEEVKTLQKTLTNLGYDPGEINGHFGDATEAAVREFQTDQNITVDGLVGRETKITLRNVDPGILPVEKEPTKPVTNDEKKPKPPTNSTDDDLAHKAPEEKSELPDGQPAQSAPDAERDPDQNKQFSPEEIKQIQNNLRKLGYYIGDYDIPQGNPRTLKY